MLLKKRLISAIVCAAYAAMLMLPQINTSVQAAEREDYNELAEFSVTSAVINEDVPPWTYTSLDNISGSTSPITNQMIRGGGFEPIVMRTKFSAGLVNGNTIQAAKKSDIDGYDMYNQGLFDGGDAYVYRAVDGRIRLIGKSTVASFNCSGNWKLWSDKAVSGTKAYIGFTNTNRETDYYFAVAAVDADGNESPKSQWVSINKKSSYTSSVDNLNSFSEITGKDNTAAALTAPVNVESADDSDNKCAVLSWNAVAGAAGYVVYKSNHAPQNQKGYGIELQSGTPFTVKKDDMIILDKTFYEWSRNKNLSPRIYNSARSLVNVVLSPVAVINNWTSVDTFSDEVRDDFSWKLGKHSGVPNDFKNAGKSFMEINLKKTVSRSTPARIQLYNIGESYSGQNNWYKTLEVGHTYVVEFWAKANASGAAKVDIGFSGFLQSVFRTQTFDITDEWKKYSIEYTYPADVTESMSTVLTMLSVYGNASTVSIDAFQMYDKATEPYLWSEKNVQASVDSGFSYHRSHTFIKVFQITYDMDMICNPSGAFNNSVPGSVTLDTFLKNCKAAQINPWFQIEFHMSAEEWLGWMEFMCAEYNPDVDSEQTKPFAYKRWLAGQQKPWVDEFDGIKFEISNETWNGMFAPGIFEEMTDESTGYRYNSSEAYGLFHQYVVDIIKTSPYWDKMAPKFKTVLGGWKGNNHELNAAKWSEDADFLTRAEYNGGWDDGTILGDNDEGYFFTSVFGIQVADPNGRDFLAKAKEFGENRPLGSYEAGPGYPLPKSYLTEQEQIEHNQANNVQKSLTGAASTMDAFLMNAAYFNHDTQNFFTFDRGRNYWTSHTDEKDGGQEHVAFRALTMFNNYASGDFVRVDEISAPKYDIPAVYKSPDDRWASRKSVDNAPMVAVYATKDEKKFSVFVISRKLPNYPFEDDDGYTPFILNLPFDKVHKINVHKMTGPHTANNIYQDNVKIQEQTIDPSNFKRSFVLNEANGAEERGIAPNSIYLYDFYLDYAGLPTQPTVSVSNDDGDRTISWAAEQSKKFFIYKSDRVDGVYTIAGSTKGNVSSFTLEGESEQQSFYKVRAFNSEGYRDSQVISGDGDTVTLPDVQAETILYDDPPEPEVISTTLLWDDFTYADQSEPEHGAKLVGLMTGGPLGNGWREYTVNGVEGVGGAYDSSWGPSNSSNSNSIIVNSNMNNDKPPLVYGNLKVSGVYATTRDTLIPPESQHPNAPRRIIERDYGKIANLALSEYIGSDKPGYWPPPIGSINGTTLWYSNLMRSSESGTGNISGYMAFFSNHNANSEHMAVGYFPGTTDGGQRYWGARYKKSDGSFAYTRSDFPVTVGETVFVVMKLDFQKGNDAITIWFNPDEASLGGEQPTGGTSISVNFDSDVDFLPSGIGFANTSGNYSFDFGEIRYGSDYAGVSPAPKPSIKVTKEKLMSVSFNVDSAPRNLTVVITVFNREYNLQEQIILHEYKLNPYDFGMKTVDLSGYNIRCSRDKIVKVFVWDDFEEIFPRSAVFTYPPI